MYLVVFQMALSWTAQGLGHGRSIISIDRSVTYSQAQRKFDTECYRGKDIRSSDCECLEDAALWLLSHSLGFQSIMCFGSEA
ncbi:hypothetical protein QBC42DRAFT_267946 [Cladorrhinum samala]|uniref:Uncharacterized protein n=1 Tax=Cladorrhinum samala TaxID=585594 RepID=A0AAV9HNH0_9PEZI|nr:hypothetical protein QBC42DRAFT_267946 [Cladorrhinum samala]